jgi:hypothetical protein
VNGTVHRCAVATVGEPPWSREFLRELFVDHPDSVRNFWRRATFGLVDLEFDFVDAAAGPDTGGYDHVMTVEPATATLPVLYHEVGHALGFQHAFGDDPYCVMGRTGTGRRPSAASLWRHLAAVKLSPRRVSHVCGVRPAPVRIVGLCAAGDEPCPVVAVVLRQGHPNQHLTVEYRPAVGDDAGVAPAVVVHSIGANFVGAGRDEVDPPWFEASLPPVVGASADVLGYRFTVVDVSTAAPESVEVRIQRAGYCDVGGAQPA